MRGLPGRLTRWRPGTPTWGDGMVLMKRIAGHDVGKVQDMSFVGALAAVRAGFVVPVNTEDMPPAIMIALDQRKAVDVADSETMPPAADAPPADRGQQGKDRRGGRR